MAETARGGGSMARPRGKIAPEVAYTLAFFAGSRILLTFLGNLARALVEPGWPEPFNYQYSDRLRWLDLWGQWDSGWYVGLASTGYPIREVLDYSKQEAFVFFPLYPALMRILSDLAVRDWFLAGLIVSNVCLLGAALILYRLARLDEDEATALNAITYLFAFPATFLLSAVLTESLYLCLALGSFYAARRGRWALAGAIGSLAALTRPIGVLILIPLLIEYAATARAGPRLVRPAILWLLLVPAGLGAYAAYNFRLTGDALAFWHFQGAWERTPANPFVILPAIVENPFSDKTFWLASALLGLILLVAVWRSLRPSYAVFAAIGVLIPLSAQLDSIPRYLVVVFPFYIVLARLHRRPALDQQATVLCAITQGFLMVAWAIGFEVAK